MATSNPSPHPFLSTLIRLTGLLTVGALACDPETDPAFDEGTTTFAGSGESSEGLAESDGLDDAEHRPARPLGPPAPAVEDMPDTPASVCEAGEDPCEGIAPLPPPPEHNLARTGKRTRGSNSQLAIPQNLLLADIDADGASDFVQYSSNKLFASKTDFNKTGILHLYTGRPIKRVITGDFHGDKYDQTCIITDDNVLTCYAIGANKKELWWWFPQSTFIADNEDSIVGDFDGDGRDDILVYPRLGGPLRMYSISGGNYYFSATPKFSQGNLAGTGAGMQIRAGDFDGNGRDDIMVVNPSRQILHYVSVFDGTNNTFWWNFTSNANFVSADEQVTVARVDDNAVDDIVLHNRVTGATRFHRMEFGGGNPPALPATTGQIGAMANSLLFWGTMNGTLPEPGGATRDDAMIYDLNWNMWVRSDARWDGAKPTYWWAYTQWAPNNHAGWAPLTSKPLLVLKCKLADLASEPKANQFYRDLIFSALVPYWRDLSYGSYDLSGSKLIDTWYTMAAKTTDWPHIHRYDRVGQCLSAYGGSTAGYVNPVAFVNTGGDEGESLGRVLVSPGDSNAMFIGHETAHAFGWAPHSYDDTSRQTDSWSGPGEYWDHWDIMSARNVLTFAHPQGVIAGPEMNAPYKTRAGFIPAHRIVKLVPGGVVQTWQSTLAAIHRPEGNGALMVRVGADDNNYYTVEYRMKNSWDQGIPRATVLVHRVTNGASYLITAGNGPERLVGSVSKFPLGNRDVKVTVQSFAAEGYTASVKIEY